MFPIWEAQYLGPKVFANPILEIMSIHITPDKSLANIQQEFHQKFPYLKIEFFRKKHGDHAASPRSAMLPVNQSIREAGTFDGNTEISVDGHLKVSTFEKDFQDHYGIGIQVFRKSGNVWLLTTATDGWTLSQENREGGEDSN